MHEKFLRHLHLDLCVDINIVVVVVVVAVTVKKSGQKRNWASSHVTANITVQVHRDEYAE
jgi:hypothetical protein